VCVGCRVNVRCRIAHAGADVNDSECWNELARLRIPAYNLGGNASQAGDVQNQSAGLGRGSLRHETDCVLEIEAAELEACMIV
jgi:hypothetical protein